MKTEQEIKDIRDEARRLFNEQQGSGTALCNRLDGIYDALDFVLGDLASWELL